MSAGTNSFWTSLVDLVAGTLARAADVNSRMDGIAEGFDAVEAELDKCIQITGTGMTTFDISSNAATRADKIIGFDATGAVVTLLTDSATSAEAWATTTGALVEATDYSAKEYAIGTFVPSGSAKDWAITAEDTPVNGSAYSALHWAAKAAASAAGVNLPAIAGGDAGKQLYVNSGESGYELLKKVVHGTAAFNTGSGSGTDDITITHGLGTDNVDVEWSFVDSIITFARFAYSASITPNSVCKFQHSPSYSSGFGLPSAPASGDVVIRLASNGVGAFSGTLYYTIRSRD